MIQGVDHNHDGTYDGATQRLYVNGKLVKKSETATAFSWEQVDRAEELRKAARIK